MEEGEFDYYEPEHAGQEQSDPKPEINDSKKNRFLNRLRDIELKKNECRIRLNGAKNDESALQKEGKQGKKKKTTRRRRKKETRI